MSILAAVVLLASRVAAPLAPYQLEDGICASFPKEPTHDQYRAGGDLTDRYTIRHGVTVYRLAVSHYRSPGIGQEVAANPGGRSVQLLFDKFFNGLTPLLKGKIVDSQFGEFKGSPAKRCRIEGNGLSTYALCVLTPEKPIAMLILAPRGAQDLAQVQTFFDSLDLSK